MGIQTPGHTQTPVCRPGWGSQQLCAPKHLCVAAFQVPWSLKAIMQVALFHAVSLKSQWLGNLQLKPTLAHMRTVNLCLGSCTADASQILQAPRSPSWQSRSQRRPTSLQNRAKPTQAQRPSQGEAKRGQAESSRAERRRAGLGRAEPSRAVLI